MKEFQRVRTRKEPQGWQPVGESNPSFQVENLSGFPQFPNVFNNLRRAGWVSDRVGTAWHGVKNCASVGHAPVTFGHTMTCRICPKCEAKFMDGQLFWSTGQKGDPEVLANLVCDLPQVQRAGGCINPANSNPAKDTWEKRRAFADALADEMDLPADSDDFKPRDFLAGFDD